MSALSFSPFDNHTLRRVITLTLSGAALGLFVGCGKKEEVVFDPGPRPVKMMDLEGGKMRRLLDLPGQVEPLREATMGFEVPGLVLEVLVDEGVKVSQGDLLARLDPRDYAAARDSAAAQLKAARSEADRAEALYARQATSQQRLDTSLAQAEVAEAAFEQAEKAYQDTFLRAPMDGVVARVFVDDIINVQAKETIMLLHDMSQFKIVVDAPETIVILIDPSTTFEDQQVGVKTTVFMTTGTEAGFPAKIMQTALTANPETRTFASTFTFDPPTHVNVLPGMTARLRVDATALIVEEHASFDVPSHAIGSDPQNRPYVWVVDPDAMTVSRKLVTTGRMSGPNMEVYAEDLAPGDTIAVSGLLYLREGMEVRRFEK